MGRSELEPRVIDIGLSMSALEKIAIKISKYPVCSLGPLGDAVLSPKIFSDVVRMALESKG